MIYYYFLGSGKQLNNFLKYVNTSNIHPNISFTLEYKSNNTISFLDFTITKEKRGIYFTFKGSMIMQDKVRKLNADT